MLREWKEPVRPGEEELKMRLAAAREKLAAQQLLIKEQKVPVLVLLEGWGTAGKGYCIGQIIENIDPRHFKVESMERKTGEEAVFIPPFYPDSGGGKVCIFRFRLDG